MRSGGWIPISKGFARALPRDRAFTELEAGFSLQLDFDQGREVTLSGYASLWRWSKDKVRRFLAEMGVEIAYPGDTSQRQNQRGHLKPTDNRLIIVRKPSDNRLIKFLDSSDLGQNSDRKPTDNRLKTDRRSDTTKDPRSSIERSTFGFDEFWSGYPRKTAKQNAAKVWQKIAPSPDQKTVILNALEQHKGSEQWQRDGGKFIPHPATWLNGRRWEDEITSCPKAEEAESVSVEEFQNHLQLRRSYGLE